MDDELDELFGQLPAVLLDGPKAVGKTRTAEQRAVSVRRLHDATERQIVEADPTVVATDTKPVLIDEHQRVPATWDAVKWLIDKDLSGGQYLFTGSEPVSGSHSGAGRITTLRMRPLTLLERGVGSPTVSLAEILHAFRRCHHALRVQLAGFGKLAL